jgi:hypothetical protein
VPLLVVTRAGANGRGNALAAGALAVAVAGITEAFGGSPPRASQSANPKPAMLRITMPEVRIVISDRRRRL